MKSICYLPAIMAALSFLPQARAGLTTNLVAYYDFDQTGAAGLVNKAPGATGFPAVRAGTLHADWAAGASPTGPGFTGNPAFVAAGTSGTSDRSVLHTGSALNLDDDRDEHLRIPLGTAELGGNFTLSVWHALTPGDANTSNRYHVFESDMGYDVSWGTANTTFAVPQSAYQYLGYLAQGVGFGPSGVATQTWHHVAHCFSSDGTTTTLRQYVDGVFTGSRTALTSDMNFAALLLGRQRMDAASDRDWDGMLDEAAVWKRSLTANEVTEIWQRGQAGLTLTADPAIIGKAFINVEPSDPAGGQTYGTGLYDLNETVSVGAMEGLGYVYNGWAAPFTSQLQTFNHIVTGSTVITANLARNPSDDDHDGLTAWQELVVYLTDPAVADSDADGISDGDEVNGSRTNPLDSQAGAIQYILDNLCTGGVQPGDVVLATGPGNTLRIRLKASATTDFSAWSPLLPSAPGLTGAQSGGVFRLTVPATSAPKRFLRMAGSAP